MRVEQLLECVLADDAVAEPHHVTLRRRMRHQLGNGAREADASAVQERHLACETSNLVDSLRRPEDGRAATGESRYQLADAPRTLGIQIMCRLVHEEHGWLREEGTCDAKTLVHAV